MEAETLSPESPVPEEAEIVVAPRLVNEDGLILDTRRTFAHHHDIANAPAVLPLQLLSAIDILLQNLHGSRLFRILPPNPLDPRPYCSTRLSTSG